MKDEPWFNATSDPVDRLMRIDGIRGFVCPSAHERMLTLTRFLLGDQMSCILTRGSQCMMSFAR